MSFPNTLSKSKNLDFGTYRRVSDEYESDSDSDISSQENVSNYSSFSPMKSQSQIFTVEMAPMFDSRELKIVLDLPTEPLQHSDLIDAEQDLNSFTQDASDIISRVEPIECVAILFAHLDQFPKPTSKISESIPCLYGFQNMNTAFPSEYLGKMQKYYKSNYQNLRQHLKFFFSIAPSKERLSTLGSIRKENSSGRILFHYTGYGFPTITENNIWTSEHRSTEFEKYELSQLFIQLLPPTWFLFDCSNAGVVIKKFNETTNALKQKYPNSGVDWDDWFCICATRADENLPSDPRLPHDFLTSCILNPIKTALLCHILKNYRTTLVGPGFPEKLPCEHLISEKSEVFKRLSLSLSAITDAIAADIIPSKIYHCIFRCDRLSAIIFRRFLLAQYLLKPYRAHPVSKPSLPDSSSHPLWKQWSVILDSAICSVSITKDPPVQLDIFNKVADSFKTLLDQRKYEFIRPYHLTLLFHMLFSDDPSTQPLTLLAKYASSDFCKKNPDMLISSSVFHPLFAKLIGIAKKLTACPEKILQNINENQFQPLCFLILTLLKFRPSFANEIQKEIDVTDFPNLIFKHNIPEPTRVLITAILSTLVTSHESFQQTCTTYEFLLSIKNELSSSSSLLSLWLLILVRRSFNLFSPDPTVYVPTGIHVQIALFLFHRDHLVRASALAALTSFLRPYECASNGQLVFPCLFLATDASSLVRFHLILMIKKFVTSFDSYSDTINSVNESPFSTVLNAHSSFSSMISALYWTDMSISNLQACSRQFFEIIDNSVHMSLFLNHCYSSCMYLLNYFCADPSQSVSSLAQTVRNFVIKLRTAYEATLNDDISPRSKSHSFSNSGSFGLNMEEPFLYVDDEFEEENNSFGALDQNESLFQISLRVLLQMDSLFTIDDPIPQQKQSPKTMHISSEIKSDIPFSLKIGDNAISKIVLDDESNSMVVISDVNIYWIQEEQNQFKVIKSIQSSTKTAIVDAVIVRWDQTLVVFSTLSGSVEIWNPFTSTSHICFRASPEYFNNDNPIYISATNIPFEIVTAGPTSIYIWNVSQQKLVGEILLGSLLEDKTLASFVVDKTNFHTFIIGFSDGSIYQFKEGKEGGNLIFKSSSPINQIVQVDSSLFFISGKDFFKHNLKKSSNLEEKLKIDLCYQDIDYFDGNDHYLVFISKEQMFYTFENDKKNLLEKIKNANVCAIHRKKPLLVTGNEKGDLLIMNL